MMNTKWYKYFVKEQNCGYDNVESCFVFTASSQARKQACKRDDDEALDCSFRQQTQLEEEKQPFKFWWCVLLLGGEENHV